MGKPLQAPQAYARRADEYIDLFGAIDSVHPADLELVTRWARGVGGPILDAGCGPGQWTAHLEDVKSCAGACGDASLGTGSHAGVGERRLHVRGIDGAPEFVDHARSAHPECEFDLGDLDALPYPDAQFGGVLSWYSVIHHEPAQLRLPLAEFARVLRPGGGLLIGFFLQSESESVRDGDGAGAGKSVGDPRGGGTPGVESFDHAVVVAYRWSLEAMADQLRMAGFEAVETHTRTGPGYRPHGAIIARLAADDAG